ncbi:MAG: FkbM family methyltransferase [Candidatus Lokiarchaeota archaeon]|nr:FkbM family methyltransferase [Candidatus Lokiarchaeota archaeon]
MIFKKFLYKVLIFFTKFIPNGLPIPILKGPLKGFKLIAGAAAGSGKGLSIILNLSETERLNKVEEIMLKNIICFDVGANIGLYSLLFSKYSKQVYAFEPVPRNIIFLKRMLKLNKVKNVKIIPFAVSNHNKVSWFKEGDSYATGSLNEKGDYLIRTISLDTFINKKKIFPDILKIDVEGTEIPVLEGSKNLLLKSHPKIIIEIHGDDIRKKCFTLLKKVDYRHFIPLDANSIEGAKEFLITP